MSSFSERYKNYKIAELLDVIQNPSGYKPEALKAAKKELERRQVSEKEIELAQERLRNYTKNEKHDYYEIVDRLLDIFKPIKDESKRTSITFNRIFILLVSLFIYYIIRSKEYFRVIFSGFQDFDFFSFIFFLELFYILFVIYILFKRKTYAWTFACLFCVLKLLYLAVFDFSWMAIVLKNDFENFHLEYFYDSFIVLAFYSGLLWLLLKPFIKEHFTVKTNF